MGLITHPTITCGINAVGGVRVPVNRIIGYFLPSVFKRIQSKIISPEIR
ncbi:MAG: hypothetical protein F6K25_30635 [Okeania sp. SIO2G4]|nr:MULTISPECIES: hypothetical protein [unclassified Okeania]NEP05847.1 hypothetical protein [Okeania sp. SIO4D6]NEP39578.1 hypothetical protein [Okeania sp. SIO2H7]NEP75031.1 hypothetical protein [Okeania sp. SIO2G5]NEP96115.1 hypothetical protein [Okeania sp. SIO2F5]NEQ94754.1 hypothetical protein [Okeania sp. SIO2G4]